jgi:putative ABC transport system substrate-binding protein
VTDGRRALLTAARDVAGPLRPEGGDMKRRAFLYGTILMVARYRSAQAQQPVTMVRVGMLLFGSPANDPGVTSLREGLRALGYVEGKNIVLEYRFAEGKAERLPDLARELAALKPNVIVALGGDVAPAAKAATNTIPIVAVVSLDPVQAGLVGGLARPGGNITGVTFASAELAAKRLQFLKEAAPAISRVAVLWSPAHPDFEFKETLAAARHVNMQVQSLEVGGAGDFSAAFLAAAKARAECIIVASSRLMTVNRQLLTDLAAVHHIILVSGWGPWAQGGALLSYGPDLDAIIRHAASHVDKILKGAKPGDLPIEQPTKFELAINLKTAKAFGLSIPPSLLGRADQVIE